MSSGVHASDDFACLRDLMPATETGALQIHRSRVERPFVAADKYIVFPEVSKTTLTGFYVYGPGRAWYYDAMATVDKTVPVPLKDLKPTALHSLYNLTAQPDGLATITLRYLPGFGMKETDNHAPAMLGSSVLPVVGAFFSRGSEALVSIYHNPDNVPESEVKDWIYNRMARKPANEDVIEIHRVIAELKTLSEKSNDELWRPLHEERKGREQWVKSHNLDDQAFRAFTRAMETSCKK